MTISMDEMLLDEYAIQIQNRMNMIMEKYPCSIGQLGFAKLTFNGQFVKLNFDGANDQIMLTKMLMVEMSPTLNLWLR